MSGKNSIEQITHYQNVLNKLHEGGFVQPPELPDPEKLGDKPDATALELTYLKYLVIDHIVQGELAYSPIQPELFLDYVEKVAHLGEYLRKQGKIPQRNKVK